MNTRQIAVLQLSLIALISVCAVSPVAAQMPTVPLRDTQPDTFQIPRGSTGDAAVPARVAPLGPRTHHTVGIFYFLWQSGSGDGKTAPFDITKILAANPDSPAWGPRHGFHFWGEPQFGYYAIEDPWILRKHAQMLTDAGVDVVLLDATNAFTYPEAYLALCKVYTEMRQQGNRTPQLAFILNSSPGQTATKLWNEFYGKNLYPELWYRWQGKPLILADPAELTPEQRDFFTIRQSWAWSDSRGWFGDGKDKWPWLDHSPQKWGWHDAPDKPEEMPVAVAQHATTNIGRSYQQGKQPAPNAVQSGNGLYFAEQWKRAYAVDPPFVFITGWNEWIAQRFVSGPDGTSGFLGKPAPAGSSFFVDQYSEEFSRDLEPRRGGWGDAYYYLLVETVRRYKGVRPAPAASAPRTINIRNPFTQWASVQPEYRDDRGDTAHRDFHGFGGYGHFTNRSGRNDIVAAKVTRDKQNAYFYVRTAQPLTTPNTTSEWMTLLFNNDRFPREKSAYTWAVRQGMWQGKPQTLLYVYSSKQTGPTRSKEWVPVAPVTARVTGREMQVAVPLRLLKVTPLAPLHLAFKWVDNVKLDGDGSFLADGDAAPNGRFQYRFDR